MTILTTQDQLVDASGPDLVETYNALTGEAVKRFSSAAVGRVRCANAMLAAQDRSAHAGVLKGEAPTVESIAAHRAKFLALEAQSRQRKDPPVAAKASVALAQTALQQLAATVTKPKEEPKPQVVHASPEVVAQRLKDHHCPLCGSEHDQTRAGLEGTVASERGLCHHCGEEYWLEGKKAGQLFKRRQPGRDAAKAISASWNDADTRAARSLKQKVSADGVTYRSVREAFKALGLPDSKHVKFRMELKAAGSLPFKHGDKTHHFAIVADTQLALPV